MKKNIFIVIAIILAQVIYLLVGTVQKETELQSGTTYRIPCHPYDPRDIFRGDYIRLQYTINRKPLYEFVKNNPDLLPKTSSKSYKKYYIVASIDDNSLVLKRISTDFPENLTKNEIPLFAASHYITNKNEIFVFPEEELLPENYYVPEKTGELSQIWSEAYGKDTPMPNFKFSMDIVPRKGQQALLKQLYVNDMPYNEAYDRIKNKQWPLTLEIKSDEKPPVPGGQDALFDDE